MSLQQFLLTLASSLLAGLAGILVGHRLAFNFSRLAKFEDQFIQLNLRKFEKLNNLWDKIGNQYLFVGHEPHFLERWNANDPMLLNGFLRTKDEIDKAYNEVGFLMSKHMGYLFEYISRCLIEKILVGPKGEMAQISLPMHEKILKDLDKYQHLMMSLLKLECNADAIDGILYSRFKRYDSAIKNFQENINKFLEKHKTEFDFIEKSLNEFPKP
jgi:hypothetical protein